MSDWLDLNLDVLDRVDGDLAERLREAEGRSDITWEESREKGVLTATVVREREGGGEERITMASKYKPTGEAKDFACDIDFEETGALVVLGCGLGYHVGELAKRTKDSMIVVYEGDIRMLRSVLERIDCRGWLGANNVFLFVGDVAGSELTRRLEYRVNVVTLGTKIVTHAPSRRLDDGKALKFNEEVTRFVGYCRSVVATSFALAAASCRNLANNLGLYSGGARINELRDLYKGNPAVLVSAGPSLAKNIHLLDCEGIRERAVIIGVQTVLRPLLDRGVRPHFVTALDYHEISRRFYEGIGQLDDVTLVAEPKANKAILDSYPGPIRMCCSSFLDLLLGSVSRPVDALQAGATVAHLSFYLAQYLGCDPIIFIGQDLAFSDGLYYCPGTAIHEVWSCELSPFVTLEMMEWKRIARTKRSLRERTDVNGKKVYTDEQMLPYHQQFERDFAAAPQQIINATEGGLPKAHTQNMTLSEALERYAVGRLPEVPIPSRALDIERLEKTHEHLQERIKELHELRKVSQRTIPVLRDMIKSQRDLKKMDRLFKKLKTLQERVGELNQAFSMVDYLNQIGVYKRMRADRAIRIDKDADEYERQKRQLERDIINVEWLVEGCDEGLSMFDEANTRLIEQLGMVG